MAKKIYEKNPKRKIDTQQRGSEQSEENVLSKSNFVRQFLFYFAIIAGLVVIAYILAVLPSILVKGGKTNAQEFSSDIYNQSELEEIYSKKVCNISMTDESKFYNAKYSVYMNGTYIGYLDYQMKKKEEGYERIINYQINTSAMLKASNISTSGSSYGDLDNETYGAQIQSNLTYNPYQLYELYELQTIIQYDKSFQCKNATSVVMTAGSVYTESVPCITPDIPYEICEEELVAIDNSSFTIETEAGSFTVKEYLLKLQDAYGTGAASTATVTFSVSPALPFPVIIDSEGMQLKLDSYSKIE